MLNKKELNCKNNSNHVFNILGKYGLEIRPAFWLNMPFLLVPMWGAVSFFRRPRDPTSVTLAKVRSYNISEGLIAWPGLLHAMEEFDYKMG